MEDQGGRIVIGQPAEQRLAPSTLNYQASSVTQSPNFYSGPYITSSNRPSMGLPGSGAITPGYMDIGQYPRTLNLGEELKRKYSVQSNVPIRETVKLVENNNEYKVYQYRSVKRESILIESGDRRVVTGDRYSDGSPVKRNTHQSETAEVPFNPRRSTTYSTSKYITVVRNGREIREEIYDYN